MHHLLSHPRLLRAVALGAVLLLAGWTFVSQARADRFPPDPVEVLRQAIRQDEKAARTPEVLKARKAILQKKADGVTKLGDLSRALTLQELSGKSLDPDLDDIWNSLAERFRTGIKNALKSGDSTTIQATARLLSEMAIRARQGGVETQRVENLLPGFAPELIAQTRSSDDAVAVAVLRALGRIYPDPEKAIPALERVLAEGPVGPRRAAAEALLNMALVASESVKKRQGDRSKMVKAAKAAFQAALGGVGDSDATVRRFSLDALQQVALALADQIIIPPPDTLNFPPPERKVWSEDERKRALEYKREVEMERAELRPLVEVLREGGQPVVRALADPDPEVRLRARLALEDIATARQKMRHRVASIPEIPPEEPEKKDQDKNEEKKNDKQGQSRLPAVSGGIVLVRADEQPREQLPQPRPRQGEATSLPEVIAGLARGLFDPDVRSRLAAVDALEAAGPDAAAAAPALIKALGDHDPFVRWSAARTLGKLAPALSAAESVAAVRGLVTLLCDVDLDVRVAALVALQLYGPYAGEAVPALIKALASKDDPDVHVASIDALDAIGTAAEPSITGLITALSDASPRVRRAAAALLGRFGPAARPAIPALRRALNDTDADTRKNASDALLNLQSK
jgi:HEAT repeat protein